MGGSFVVCLETLCIHTNVDWQRYGEKLVTIMPLTFLEESLYGRRWKSLVLSTQVKPTNASRSAVFVGYYDGTWWAVFFIDFDNPMSVDGR